LAGSARPAVGAGSPTSVICFWYNVVSSADEALHFGMIKDIVRAVVPHSLWLRLHYVRRYQDWTPRQAVQSGDFVGLPGVRLVPLRRMVVPRERAAELSPL